MGRETSPETMSRRQHHSQAIEAAHRTDQPTPSDDAWRERRHVRQREYLLDAAGLHLEDLDEDTARWVEHITSMSDSTDLGGLVALVEAARGHVTGGEPVRTPADRVDELHRPRCCDTPSPDAVWGLGTADNAFVAVECRACRAELVVLDPPSTGNTAPYVGDLRHGVAPTGPWDEE